MRSSTAALAKYNTNEEEHLMNEMLSDDGLRPPLITWSRSLRRSFGVGKPSLNYAPVSLGEKRETDN
jgi:hypothetical protein